MLIKRGDCIAITIGFTVALSGIRGPVIKTLIHYQYLALFDMLMESGDEFVDFKAFKVGMTDWSISGAPKFTFRDQSLAKRETSCLAPTPAVSFECMKPWIRTARISGFKLLSIFFALAQTQLQAGFVELEEISPQAVNYLRNFKLGAVGNASTPLKAVWA